MKKLSLLYVLVLFFALPLLLSAQESNKEVKVKIVKVVDGKTTVIDTVYSSKSDVEKEIEMVVESVTEVDSTGSKTIRIEMISDESDSEDQEYEVIVHSLDNADSQVFVSSPKGKRKVMTWIDKDGEEQEFEFNMEIEEMEKMGEDIERQVRIIMEQTEGLDMDIEALEAEKILFLKDLPPPPPPAHPAHFVHPTPEVHWFTEKGDSRGSASEKELRAAGIKNKPDLLKLKELDIDNRNGVITLRFLPEQEEGSSKVTVFNYFGEKVFSGKPEMAGGVFQMTIDLSSKQPGTYYIQIVQKKSSVTERIRL
jgi:hypothetical protein